MIKEKSINDMKRILIVSGTVIFVVIIVLLAAYFSESIEKSNYFKDKKKMLVEDIDDEIFSADISIEELKKLKNKLKASGITIAIVELSEILKYSEKVKTERNEEIYYEVKLNVKYKNNDYIVTFLIRWGFGSELMIKSTNFDLLIEFHYAWWKIIG